MCLKIVAIIQARMSSSRLPGKVMLPLAGKPALFRIWERLSASKLIDEIVVATSIDPSDDPVVKFCSENNIELQISKSFYIGFLGKVIGSILFFVTLLIILPMLNGGVVPNFQDVISWRYADPTFIARFKYFLFI